MVSWLSSRVATYKKECNVVKPKFGWRAAHPSSISNRLSIWDKCIYLLWIKWHYCSRPMNIIMLVVMLVNENGLICTLWTFDKCVWIQLCLIIHVHDMLVSCVWCKNEMSKDVPFLVSSCCFLLSINYVHESMPLGHAVHKEYKMYDWK